MKNKNDQHLSSVISELDIHVVDIAEISREISCNDLAHRLASSIELAQNDPSVRGIVLSLRNMPFSVESVASDNSSSSHGALLQWQALTTLLEHCKKPVVCALGGTVEGVGFELALACHGRVAIDSAKLGFPEIDMGLIPCLGGTQRLPRLIAPQLALSILHSGTAKSVVDFACTTIFDNVVVSDVVNAATRLSMHLAMGLENGVSLPRTRDLHVDATDMQHAIAIATEKLSVRQKKQPAYLAVLEALRASTLPFDEGLVCEQAQFQCLVKGSPSWALRYQLRAERDASDLAQGLHGRSRDISKVAVIGAGTMGAGIAICALDAGLHVILLEQDDAALQRGSQRVDEHYRARVRGKKLTLEQMSVITSHLKLTVDWKCLGEADVVIEAVFEDLGVKQDVFRKIDQYARDGAVLATNTSYLDIDAIAAVTKRPADVLGLHFFSPANVMKLLEVVRGGDSNADVLATGMRLGLLLKKRPVLTGNAFGFIGNRIYNAYRKQCEFMLEDGAWPEDVDSALTAMGLAMGPFAVADLSGLDIAWRMRKAQAATRNPRERYVMILDQLCEAGRLGRKTDHGYYDYPDGKQCATTSRVVRLIIEDASAARGIVRRPLSPEVIQRRALLSMVNEAALLFAQGVAARPSDIDVVLVQGYGFPRWVGGPVFWAKQQERVKLDADLDQLLCGNGFGSVRASSDMLDHLLDPLLA